MKILKEKLSALVLVGRPTLVMLGSHVRELFCNMAALLLMQVLADMPGRASKDGPSPIGPLGWSS